MTMLYAVIAVVVIIAAAALLWWFSSGSHAKAALSPSTTIVQTQSNSNKVSAEALLAAISEYPAQSQFTANYTGTIYTSLSTNPAPMTGNLSSQYERYNNSAKSVTAIAYNKTARVDTSVYYSDNGPSYACILNTTTTGYACQAISTQFNSSTFGLSVFLAALSNSSSKGITVSNSSYKGMPCLLVSANTNTAFNNSGVLLTSNEQVSSCIQPRYRIPLTMNISSFSSASGNYLNGTTKTAVPPISEALRVNFHLVSIKNSSSKADVTNLPANAVMVG
jgi:hypothetical protein